MRVDAPSASECPSCVALRGALTSLRELAARQAALLDEQRVQLDEQSAQLDELRTALEKLRAQVGQNSGNSSWPPSSDRPGNRPRKRDAKPAGRRKRGGQPGHKGKARQMLPLEQLARVEVCKPTNCANCGSALHGEDASPECHQVTDIPPVVAETVEYQLHTLGCTDCGHSTPASLPDGVSWSPFGPRLRALVAALGGVWRMPKRSISEYLSVALGVSISLGAISNIERTVSDALRTAVEDARAFVKRQLVAHLDETGWRENNRKAWLWTAVTATVTVFVIRASRGAKVARELLGDAFNGVVNSDRWSGYNWLPVLWRQLCWAHLKRDFKKLAEVGGPDAAIGEDLEQYRQQLFAWWHRVRDGTMDRSTFQAEVFEKVRPNIIALLTKGSECKTQKVAGMCKAMLQLEPAMWTFVRIEGVEPTNNTAERAVRHGVIWRKISFGTQNRQGSEFTERMFTVVATLRQQERNVLDFVTASCEAAAHRRQGPSLIP